MEFYEVIKTRRSVRSYINEQIPDDVLTRVLEAARIAPSGCNRQPWSFVVVRQAATREKLAKACCNQGFIGTAPVVIVCCGKRYDGKYQPWLNDAYMADTIIAIDHLILAARNEGLGTCWIGAMHDDQVGEIVGVPDDVDVLMVVAVGYPGSQEAFTEQCSRKSMSEVCFFEEFGKSK